MRAVHRLFPWDVVDDPGAVTALRDDGVESVALAALYHGVRAVTPRHPSRRIVDLPTSVSMLSEPMALPQGEFGYAAARAALEAGGIEVETWAVIGHLDRVLPGLARVRTAFGDRLDHAPCLSDRAVRDTLYGLVRGAAQAAPGAMLHLEAVGWQGIGHDSMHNKLHGGGLSAGALDALACCVCDRCAATVGCDPDRLAWAMRALVDGTAGAAERDLHADLVAARAMTGRRFAADAVTVAFDAGAGRVSMLSGEGEELRESDRVDLLVDCWGAPDRGIAMLAGAGGGIAYVDVLSGDPRGFEAHWRALAEAGAREVHVYHAGLASTERRRAASRAARLIA
ncbi:hypothetical protein [Microbacterium stercoris]|uniref:Uncharacterized protein n=1 Tax=Microbacterium stercoris TaxID=2820289 RepID=A0A939TST5_9MICO|nr:hypothetical protein [Microbacterium stercoris]MBO3662234.1 hypothetical protein [Microbacterium stercoris]